MHRDSKHNLLISLSRPKNPSSKAAVQKRGAGTYAAFLFVFLGALASTVVFGLSLWFQLTVRFPTLIGTPLEYQITQYLLMDTLTLLGAILLFFSSLLIYLQSSWPIDVILAIIGAIITVAIISVILGIIGGILALFNRPKR